MNDIEIKLLTTTARFPEYAYPGDAGFDIFTDEAFTLMPGERHAFKTGVASCIPQGFYLQIMGKSGLALNKGLAILGGVVDASYRGEWTVIALNTGRDVVEVKARQKIAQGVMHVCPPFQLRMVFNLSDSLRGTNGLGSTGL